MTPRFPLALVLAALAVASIGPSPATAQAVVPLADRADLAAAVAAAASARSCASPPASTEGRLSSTGR